MALTRAEISRRYRANHPELTKLRNADAWLKFKEKHPEIGTLDNPRNDTRFKAGHIKSPKAGRFKLGHTINNGRISAMAGKTHTEESKQKIRAKRKLQVISIEHRLAISAAHKAVREKNHFWKGGITEKHKRLRNSIEYKLWRESVFQRDDFTCQECKLRGVELHADHIKPFAYFPDLRFAIDNGRTLCVACHKKTDSYLGRARWNYASGA